MSERELIRRILAGEAIADLRDEAGLRGGGL